MKLLLRKLSFAALGVGIMALAASTGLSGQAPAGQAPAVGQGGGGRRGGGAAAGAPQAPGAPGAPAAPAPGAGRGPATPPQGGRGPLKVLIITRGHEFERQAFFELFDSLGEDITWTHIEHPAADDEAAAPQRAHRRHQEHRVRRRPRLRQQVADRPHRRRVVAVP